MKARRGCRRVFLCRRSERWRLAGWPGVRPAAAVTDNAWSLAGRAAGVGALAGWPGASLHQNGKTPNLAGSRGGGTHAGPAGETPALRTTISSRLRRQNVQTLPARSFWRQRMRRDSRHFLQGDLVMKRFISVAIIVASLGAAACTTAVVVRPPRAGLVLVNGIWVVPPRAGAVWIAPHWERRGYQRVWIEGFWRY